MTIIPLRWREAVKKSDTARAGLAPSPLAPLPVCFVWGHRWGEGKVNIKFNSLAPAGGEGARRAGEGVIGIFSQLLRHYLIDKGQPQNGSIITRQ